jgi:hypothetical protein
MLQHESLGAGGWFLMPLSMQLGNIGSEVNRMLKARNNPERFENAFTRGLELFDLTLSDSRWRGRFREIARARELLCDAALGGHEYNTTLEDLNKYFFYFALASKV